MKLGFLKQKPYSFLLVGATGVGKTLLVKEYAKTLYNKDSFIRLDMSEYKESHSVSKIIGSPPGYVGYNDYGNVLDKIKMNPHSVILLDEIEKANPAVLKLFLQILDEGKIKNSKGETIVFDNTLIFMTSNLGVNKENIDFNNNKNKILEEIINFLSIEFVNRIDKIFYFNNIDTKAIKKIVIKELNMLIKENEDKIAITFSTKTVNKIIKKTNYEKFGARKVEKIIDEEIYSLIVDKIIQDKKNIFVDSELV